MIEETKRENVASLLPVITEFDKVFWESLQNEVLLIQKCADCGHYQFPASPVCVSCLSDHVEWVPASGKATLWSKVRFHKAYLPPYSDVPYAVGIAKLEEGCLIEGRLSNENFDNTALDTEVDIQYRRTVDGTELIELIPKEK